MGRKVSPRQSQHVVGERCDSISDFEKLSSNEKVAFNAILDRNETFVNWFSNGQHQ